jgi:CubicO group peptidase (beta-lactamase class C family)
MLATFGVKTLVAQVRSQRATQVDAYDHAAYPANFTLLGGYIRGVGDYLNPAGRTASQTALAAVGGGSTGWMIDTERDLTFIFLSAGLVEGFAHPRRLELLNDLAIAAIRN